MGPHAHDLDLAPLGVGYFGATIRSVSNRRGPPDRISPPPLLGNHYDNDSHLKYH